MSSSIIHRFHVRCYQKFVVPLVFLLLSVSIFANIPEVQAQASQPCRSTYLHGYAFEGECIVSPVEEFPGSGGQIWHELIPNVGRLEQLPTGGYRWRADVVDGPFEMWLQIRWWSANGASGVVDIGVVRFLNAPPSGEFFGPEQPVIADSNVVIGFSNVSDPGLHDQNAPFYYAYDCDGDGQLEINFTAGLTQYHCSYLQRELPYTALGYVMDTNGGVSTYSRTILLTPPPRILSCEDPNPARDLSGTLSADYRNGTVVNASETCAYDIGLASYLMIDNVIDHQIFFDSQSARIGPQETLTLGVQLPDCASQVDLFYGEVLLSLDGVRYGSRLMRGVHTGGNWCDPQVDAPPTEEEVVVVETINAPSTGRPNCLIADARVNSDNMRDCSPPIAIYCNAGGIEVWAVNEETAEGGLVFQVSAEDIDAVATPETEHALIAEQGNILLFRLTTGELQINTWTYDPYSETGSKPYVVTWPGC